MDFDETEEQEEKIENYETPGNSGREKMSGGGGGEGASSTRKGGAGGGGKRYRECLKNHAVSIGGHAVDGCREFMPAGEKGTLNALKCAACNCHRNFHRKETENEGFHHTHHHQPPPHHQQFLTYYHRAPHPSGYLHVNPPRPLALPSTSQEEEDMSNPSSSGGGGGSGSKKRFRTKFTQEQKDKMLVFAERIEWRFQKQDEALVEQFCDETNVKRQVLKVWMHNNKHTLGKKP